MANQVKLEADARTDTGKGASGRLRKSGRVPAIMYGRAVDTPVSVSVDQLELYHALHTPAGANVLINLQLDDDEYLTVARDVQRHPVRGEVTHIDFLAVDRDQLISVEVPVHLVDESMAATDGGVINHVLFTVPILVKPLDTPNYFELSVEGMEIGDVKRVEDLSDVLPEGAQFDIDLDRTVVTVNAPTTLDLEEEEEEVEGLELLEGEELPEGEEAPEGAEGEGEAAEGESEEG